MRACMAANMKLNAARPRRDLSTSASAEGRARGLSMSEQHRSESLWKFRVGDFFVTNTGTQRYGCVTGLGVNPRGEVVLRVQWAGHPDDPPALCHPDIVEPLRA